MTIVLALIGVLIVSYLIAALVTRSDRGSAEELSV